MAQTSATLTLVIIALLSLFCSLSLALPIPPVGDVALTKRYGGRATYFSPGLGACGVQNGDNDHIVALPISDFANGAHCGKKIRITCNKTGTSHTAIVRDQCESCNEGDLDMSPSLFLALVGDLGLGVFQMSWGFV